MTKRALPTFQRYAARSMRVLVFWIMTISCAHGGAAELLSDACIADISAGTMGNTVTAFYETPATAYIDTEPRWWGDMDGMTGYGSGCASNPGFVVTNTPYTDFQYDSFKYIFKDQASVDRFLNNLPSVGGRPVNVIDTDYIKTNPSADQAIRDDGTAPRIKEIIITTDQKINGDFIRSHNGQVITQKVRIDMEFLPPYAKTYTVSNTAAQNTGGRNPILERSLGFRNYNQYEWLQKNKSWVEIVRHDDGTYSFIESADKTYNFGAVFLESGATGNAPFMSESGRVLVPAHTVYFKNSIFNDIHVYCPVFGMTIGLAPAGAANAESGELRPDLDRYQELGVLDIRNLNISLKGGNDIYLYPNEDLDVCQ